MEIPCRTGSEDEHVGSLWITGGTITCTGSGTGAVKNFSNEINPKCSENYCSIHIGGNAKVQATGTNYAVHLDSSCSGGIHFPSSFTGYVYAKSAAVLRNAGSAILKMVGGNIYSPSEKYSSGTVSIGSNVKKYKSTP